LDCYFLAGGFGDGGFYRRSAFDALGSVIK